MRRTLLAALLFAFSAGSGRAQTVGVVPESGGTLPLEQALIERAIDFAEPAGAPATAADPIESLHALATAAPSSDPELSRWQSAARRVTAFLREPETALRGDETLERALGARNVKRASTSARQVWAARLAAAERSLGSRAAQADPSEALERMFEKSAPREGVVLVTGFETFGGFRANASQHVAEGLHGRRFQVKREGSEPAAFRIVGKTLPVSFEGARNALEDAIREHAPDVVLMFGLSGRTPKLEVESFARNLKHSPDYADADGAKPNAAPVVEGAPEALAASAPVEAIVSALNSHGLPALLSRDAGLFVCNSAFFNALYEASVSAAERITAFVHLPPASEHLSDLQKTRMPHWPLEALERSSEAIVQWLAHASMRRGGVKPPMAVEKDRTVPEVRDEMASWSAAAKLWRAAALSGIIGVLLAAPVAALDLAPLPFPVSPLAMYVSSVLLAPVLVGLSFVVLALRPSQMRLSSGPSWDNVFGWLPKKSRPLVLPVVEELLCRGLMYSGGFYLLTTFLGASSSVAFAVAALLSSYIFSRLHGYGYVWPRVVLGISLCGLVFLSGSLLWPIIAHLAFNLACDIGQRISARRSGS